MNVQGSLFFVSTGENLDHWERERSKGDCRQNERVREKVKSWRG